MLAGLAVAGGWFVILPVFRHSSLRNDAIHHVALTVAALDTISKTHALPISSEWILDGRQYPYFLFGNGSFYIVSAFFSFLLRAPAYFGDALTLSAGFALGVYGIFLLGRQAGVNRFAALALGILYAVGPFPSFELFTRGDLPEYLAWQALPVLCVLVARAIQPGSRAPAILGGAIALALPFYIHKLIAPHLVVVIVLVALTTARVSVASALRLGPLGAIALLWSVPAWYPAVNGQAGLVLPDPGLPVTANPTLWNLLWPYAQNSLPITTPATVGPYFGHFTVQVGILAMAGGFIALAACIAAPRKALGMGLPVVLAVFVGYIALVMGWTAGWQHLPSYFRYLQTTARLVGVAYFLGVVLLLRGVGLLIPRIPRGSLLALAPVCLAVMALSCATYWYAPALLRLSPSSWPDDPLNFRAAAPGDIVDRYDFLAFSYHSNLVTGYATILDGWVLDPPILIPVPRGAKSLTLRASAPSQLFDAGGPVTVDLLAAQPAGQGKRPVQQLGESVSLASRALTGPGSFDIDAALNDSVDYIAIRCSRSVPATVAGASATDSRPVCVHVDQLVVPNSGDDFVQPADVPLERQHRGAFGTTTLDLRGLSPGEYLLPAFYFGFLRLTDASGRLVPVYQYDRVAAFHYDGHSPTYTVWYDMRPELGAVAAGVGLLLAYLAILWLVNRRRPAS